MVLPASRRIPRVLRYSGAGSASDLFVYGAFTLSGGAFQLSSASIYAAFAGPQPLGASSSVWAISLSLAAT